MERRTPQLFGEPRESEFSICYRLSFGRTRSHITPVRLHGCLSNPRSQGIDRSRIGKVEGPTLGLRRSPVSTLRICCRRKMERRTPQLFGEPRESEFSICYRLSFGRTRSHITPVRLHGCLSNPRSQGIDRSRISKVEGPTLGLRRSPVSTFTEVQSSTTLAPGLRFQPGNIWSRSASRRACCNERGHRRRKHQVARQRRTRL